MATDRRQWIDSKFIIQTAISVSLAVGGAVLGSYVGTQTRTAVLERTVDTMTDEMKGLRGQITSQTNEFRGLLDSLATLVNNSNLKTGQDVAKLQSDVDALGRAIEDRKSSEDSLKEYYELQASRLDGLRDRLSRLEGELKIPKKE
jgi:uncharacterized protein YoxC